MKEEKYNTTWITDVDKSRKVKWSIDALSLATYHIIAIIIFIGYV